MRTQVLWLFWIFHPVCGALRRNHTAVRSSSSRVLVIYFHRHTQTHTHTQASHPKLNSGGETWEEKKKKKQLCSSAQRPCRGGHSWRLVEQAGRSEAMQMLGPCSYGNVHLNPAPSLSATHTHTHTHRGKHHCWIRVTLFRCLSSIMQLRETGSEPSDPPSTCESSRWAVSSSVCASLWEAPTLMYVCVHQQKHLCFALAAGNNRWPRLGGYFAVIILLINGLIKVRTIYWHWQKMVMWSCTFTPVVKIQKKIVTTSEWCTIGCNWRLFVRMHDITGH